MFTIYLGMTLNVLIEIMLLAVLVAPTVFYYLNRHNSDFSRQIKIIAFIDIAFAVLYLAYYLIVGFTPDIQPSGVLLDLLYIALGVLMLVSVWKMKAGPKFAGLFKKPDINIFLFVVYMLANVFVLVKSAIGIVNYIIIAVVIVFLFWLLFVKLDVWGMAFNSSGSGSGFSFGSGIKKGFPLLLGDDDSDAKTIENGVSIDLTKTGPDSFEDQYGSKWIKTQDGGVRRF